MHALGFRVQASGNALQGSVGSLHPRAAIAEDCSPARAGRTAVPESCLSPCAGRAASSLWCCHIMLTVLLQRWPQCHALGRSRVTAVMMTGLQVARALGRQA